MLVLSDPPQIVPTTSSEVGHRHGRSTLGNILARPCSTRSRPRATVLTVPPSSLDHEALHPPPAGGDRFAQRLTVEALAAERHKQAAADVGVGAQRSQDPLGVIVGVTPGEPHHLDRAFPAATWAPSAISPGHMVSAFDEVDDEQVVPDALAAIASHVAGEPRGRSRRSLAASATGFLATRPHGARPGGGRAGVAPRPSRPASTDGGRVATGMRPRRLPRRPGEQAGSRYGGCEGAGARPTSTSAVVRPMTAPHLRTGSPLLQGAAPPSCARPARPPQLDRRALDQHRLAGRERPDGDQAIIVGVQPEQAPVGEFWSARSQPSR